MSELKLEEKVKSMSPEERREFFLDKGTEKINQEREEEKLRLSRINNCENCRFSACFYGSTVPEEHSGLSNWIHGEIRCTEPSLKDPDTSLLNHDGTCLEFTIRLNSDKQEESKPSLLFRS